MTSKSSSQRSMRCSDSLIVDGKTSSMALRSSVILRWVIEGSSRRMRVGALGVAADGRGPRGTVFDGGCALCTPLTDRDDDAPHQNGLFAPARKAGLRQNRPKPVLV